MALAWNSLAWPAAIMVPAGAILAAVVFLTAPSRRQNQLLAAFILLESLAFGSFAGFSYLWTDAPSAYASASLFVVIALAGTPIYVAFYGTLDTPLAAPLRTRWALALTTIYAVVALALWFSYPRLFFPEIRYVADAAVWVPQRGPLYFLLIYGVNGSMYVWGLVLALSALRRARTELGRRRARAYAVAFVLHDGAIALYAAALTVTAATVHPRIQTVLPVVEILFFAALAYGLVQTQLFDIDLRLKRGLRRGTVAASFVAAFFVASELAQALFEERVGPYLGVFAAGLLVFALAPLQRLAEGVANAALPRVEDTAEYRAERGREIYRAAAESALRDGVLSEKERDVLATLQEKLGISATDALALEREVTRALLPRT